MADKATPDPKDPTPKTSTGKQVAVPKDGKAAQIGQEYGVETNLPFSAWGTTGELLRTSAISLDDLVNMLRQDGQARALSRLFYLPIISAFLDGKWIANPDLEEQNTPPVSTSDAASTPSTTEDSSTSSTEESSTPTSGTGSTSSSGTGSSDGKGAEPEVDFANAMWNLPPQAGGMDSSKIQILKKTLLALRDGFAVFEEVRHVPEDGPLKGKITLEKLAYRDPRTIRFIVDQKGAFTSIRQIASVGGQITDVIIPGDKIFYWTYSAEENPYYGVSMFEAAHYHFEIKRKLYYIAHLAAQFAAVPGRIGTIPKGYNPNELRAFKQGLSDFAFNTAMTKPDGYLVEPFNGNSNFNFINLIDHHNHMMAKSVLAGFLDDENRATLIEVGSTDPNTDFFILALEAIMDDIAMEWSNKLMPKYIDWNFGSKNYPVFRFGTLSDSAKTTVKEVFETVVASSVLNCTPEFVRELEQKLAKSLDLDIDYDEIAKQEKEAAQQQADQQDQEQQQLQQAQDAQQQAQDATPPPAVPGQPQQTGGWPAPPPQAPQKPVGLSAGPDIDFLVQAATDLLLQRPEPIEPQPDDVLPELV